LLDVRRIRIRNTVKNELLLIGKKPEVLTRWTIFSGSGSQSHPETRRNQYIISFFNVASFSGMPLVWINWKDFFHGEYLAQGRHEI
jgi:hypothetical protein